MRGIPALLLAVLTTGCRHNAPIPATSNAASIEGATQHPAATADLSGPEDARQSTPNAFVYTATIRDGQVFIFLNTNPQGQIGPFVRKWDGKYVCETDAKGVHSLSRDPATGRWSYSWSYLQMRGQPVDGSVLDR